jgi:hypothetical protein
MSEAKRFMALLMAMLMIAPIGAFAANHRSAPITALDHTAGITDWYAFVSPDNPTTVTFIMDVDPLLEPSNGPNYFPFDPNVVYTMKIDNTNDAVEDITFQFQFTTQIQAPKLPLGFVGAGAGIGAPANAPQAISTGVTSTATGPVIPAAITSLSGTGAAGLNYSQTYSVTMITGTGATAVSTSLVPAGTTLYAVPSNVGPRTMPSYTALAKQGIYSLGNGVSVFAGTVDDPFFIDLGATFDSLNFRSGASFLGTAGVLSSLQDGSDTVNYAADSLSGFNVNTIALQVPISLVVKSSASPVIGTWAATYRSAQEIRLAPNPLTTSGALQQVNRMGNPLVNEVLIGLGSKDTFSMSQPSGDSQFAAFALDPTLGHVLNAAFGITVPDPPRKDLLPLVTYSGPTVPTGTAVGPVADMLRLNTSIVPLSPSGAQILPVNTGCAVTHRLGVLGGDLCGFPNGRRITDDVVDIALRAVAGALCNTPVNAAPAGGSATLSACSAAGNAFVGTQVPALGDGVNVNDVSTQTTFPYVAFAQSGYSRIHRNVGDKSCAQSSGCPAQ